MAPSWGTSCLRSRSRILSIVSIKGLRPPCTHSTAPLSPPREPPLDPDALVPAGPVFMGVANGAGELESNALGLGASADVRGKRLIISP